MVEVYIPIRDDPDHRYHGKQGEVIDTLEDDLGTSFENTVRGVIYTVRFNDPNLETADFRYDDLQPVD